MAPEKAITIVSRAYIRHLLTADEILGAHLAAYQEEARVRAAR